MPAIWDYITCRYGLGEDTNPHKLHPVMLASDAALGVSHWRAPWPLSAVPQQAVIS